jgi:hypothetical protein
MVERHAEERCSLYGRQEAEKNKEGPGAKIHRSEEYQY